MSDRNFFDEAALAAEFNQTALDVDFNIGDNVKVNKPFAPQSHNLTGVVVEIKESTFGLKIKVETAKGLKTYRPKDLVQN